MEIPSVIFCPLINPLIIKKYYYRRVFSVSKSVGNNIFLLPMNLPTDKKLRMKDSQMEHFRR
jgi:hypothetical protein